jgi:Tfp pilus assembly protein PilW
MRTQKGWTLTELIVALYVAVMLVVAVAAVYALVHFILKFW